MHICKDNEHHEQLHHVIDFNASIKYMYTHILIIAHHEGKTQELQ